MPTFEWNDETIINSYGFRVLNSGGDFSRFDSNPVMQNSHVNTTAMNLGSWKNRVQEGFKLKGDTVFDSDRDSVKEVEGQVERGFIKACSMGLSMSWDDDSWQKAPDGVWELAKWTLMEVSLCAIPSLSSALALYDKATGALIPEDELKMSLVQLSANEKLKKPNNPEMEKIILTPAAMSAMLAAGVTAPDNASEISRGVEKLQVDLTAAKSGEVAAKKKYDDFVKLQAETAIDAEILAGTIVKGEREEWVLFYIDRPELAVKQIAKLSAPNKLNGLLHNSEGDAFVKTADDFEKLTDEKKLAFKNGNPEVYKKLF